MTKVYLNLSGMDFANLLAQLRYSGDCTHCR
jgi:hypothetical protein